MHAPNDGRTDSEISTQLRAYVAPTASTKNVWAFWHSGYASMPAWCQRNVINWVRLLGPSWTVRLLDAVPGSPTHAARFVDADLLPRALFLGTAAHASTHLGDAVRLPLLQLYGGAWMDVGTMLVRHLDGVWDVLDDAATPYELAAVTLPLRKGEAETLMNGFLVVARRGNDFVARWHRIYLALWADGAADATGFHSHALLRHLRLYAPSTALFHVSPEEFTDYVAHMLCAERLRDLRCRDGFDGRRYYERNVFLLPSLQEMFRLQEWSGWDGKKEFDMMSTRLDDSRASCGRDLVRDLVENSVVIKLSHGPKGGSATTWLADFWDHRDADNEPGTLAAYLRERILNHDQKRRLIPAQFAALEAPVWEAGLLEPCGTRAA